MTDANPRATPSLPGDQLDLQRRRHSSLRRRMLEGTWDVDLLEACRAFFPASTVARFGHLDTSRNLFASVSSQVATLYDERPLVGAEGLAEQERDEWLAQLAEAGLWDALETNLLWVIGLRESLIRVDWIPGEGDDPGRPGFRAVPPDLVYAEADPDDPDTPVYLVEARLRAVQLPGDDKPEVRWCWDVADLRGEEPVFQVLLPGDTGKGQDITESVTGEPSLSGSAYPWRIDGRAVMPYVLYHAHRKGRLWDAWTQRELIEATLKVGCYWSFWGMVMRDAGYPTRWMADAEVDGARAVGSGPTGRRQVDADPGTIVRLIATSGGVVQTGQWGPAADPERMQLAIDQYEQRSMVHAGFSPDDFMAHGGAQSGYAISLKSEAKRRLIRRLIPRIERCDRQVLALAAALSNANAGTTLPTRGWNLRYTAVRLTHAEVMSRIEEARADVELGIASPVDFVLAKNPNLTRQEAEEHLMRVRQEMARLPMAR